jgi:hypothetical protein
MRQSFDNSELQVAANALDESGSADSSSRSPQENVIHRQRHIRPPAGPTCCRPGR